MLQIHISPGMITLTHKVRRGLADHHIPNYLPQTQSHLIPKGQFMQCNDRGGKHATAWQEIFTRIDVVLIYSVLQRVLKRPLLLYKPNFCSSTSWQCQICRLFPLGSRSRVILRTTFSGPWDKAPHWFPREKAHYGLSFISAVLGQFKPTRRTHFGRITEAMIDGKEGTGASSRRGNTETPADRIIIACVFTSSLTVGQQTRLLLSLQLLSQMMWY